MPSFAIDGGPALVLARGVAVAMLLLAFGTALFAAVVAPKALVRASPGVAALVGGRLRRQMRVAVALALASTLGWMLLQTADLAGVATPWAAAASLPTVLLDTAFGHVALAQVVALVGALLVVNRRAWIVAGFTGAAVALQAGHSHALAMHGVGLLLLSDMAHLLAAGAWLGGLPPLLMVVAAAPPRIGAAGARWFTPLGKICVVAMLASAVVQFWELVGGVPGLVGTAYGWTAGAKMLLFTLLLGFAVANRYRFAPALLRDDGAKRVLIRSLAVQTGVGLLAVLAASTLSALPPAIHEQPLWPFAQRPSLVAMADPDLAAEVARALLSVAAGVALLGIGAVWRRVRWPAVAGALVLGWIAFPHFDLLFVEAYSTSYYRSPTGFAADAIARGASLYPSNCAACHGVDGRGDGPASAGLATPPADLTAPHLWEHADGELFWWLSHGMDSPEGGLSMPGFAARLSVDDRWALIDYIRAHNAGVGLRDTGAWPRPVQAPAVSIACGDGVAATTSDLRGDVLHVIAASSGSASVPPVLGTIAPGIRIVTVLLARDGAAPPMSGCVAVDPAAWTAFAAIAGLSPDAMAGMQFLVDADGWLRAEERPDGAGFRWADPSALLADAQAICRYRISAERSAGHVHH